MTFTDMTEEEADERETDCDCRGQSERRHSLWKAIDYEKLMTPKPFPMRIIS